MVIGQKFALLDADDAPVESEYIVTTVTPEYFLYREVSNDEILRSRIFWTEEKNWIIAGNSAKWHEVGATHIYVRILLLVENSDDLDPIQTR